MSILKLLWRFAVVRAKSIGTGKFGNVLLVFFFILKDLIQFIAMVHITYLFSTSTVHMKISVMSKNINSL